MADVHNLTNADLLDFVEGRMPAMERAAVALRLAESPTLAAQCAQLRERVADMRQLSPVLMPDQLPADWLTLVAQIARR